MLLTDRIELYTEDYARAHGTPEENEVFARYHRAAAEAQEAGLGLNAGHDLDGIEVGVLGSWLKKAIDHLLRQEWAGVRDARLNLTTAVDGGRKRNLKATRNQRE